MNKIKGQKIVSCRICKGDHWTTRCPYKDTLGPMQKELAEQLGLSTADKDKPAGSGAAAPPRRFIIGVHLKLQLISDACFPPFSLSSRTRTCTASTKQDREVRASEPQGRRNAQRGVHATQPQRCAHVVALGGATSHNADHHSHVCTQQPTTTQLFE